MMCFPKICRQRNTLWQVTLETDIMLVVSVPVLSLHITVVQPKVSTEGNDRTIAFNLAIFFVPNARHLVLQVDTLRKMWGTFINA